MSLPPGRFTVRRWMVVVAVVAGMLALGLDVTRYAITHWGPREVMTVAPLVLFGTNIMAWFLRVRWQWFWVGFGLCGWGYLTFSLGSPLAEHLSTAKVLDALHDRVYPKEIFQGYEDDLGGGLVSEQMHRERFRRAGESVISLVYAFLGGSVAWLLFPAVARREETRRSRVVSAVGPAESIEPPRADTRVSDQRQP